MARFTGSLKDSEIDSCRTGLFESLGSKQTPKPYIKTDLDLCDDDDYARRSVFERAEHAKLKSSTDGGCLAKKSVHIDLSKRVESFADTLAGNCFLTTGFIVTHDTCIEISHMLIDSGAASSFISRKAARRAGLTVHACEPRRFSTGNDVVSHDKLVRFKLYIAGVKQKITAYIDDGECANDHHILLGVPAMRQFDMQSNHCYGRKQETRWSVAQNVRGLRRKRYVLSGDSADGDSVMTRHRRDRGLRRAKRLGETSKERDAREVLERRRAKVKDAEARYVKVKEAKYGVISYKHSW